MKVILPLFLLWNTDIKMMMIRVFVSVREMNKQGLIQALLHI